jgi:hypothetical protein
VAHDLLGHTSSYFAPVASTIVLRVVPGRRIRRAFEMVVGIAVGIAVGAAVIQEIGTGAVQIGLIVGAAVAVATLLGGSPLVASQAAGSAVLIAALPSPHAAPTRFEDALVGGLIGLAVLAVVPRNQVRTLREAVDALAAALAEILGDLAGAIERGDAAAAAYSLHRANAAPHLGGRFDQLLQEAEESATIAPVQRANASLVELYAGAAPHVDYALRNTRVLARAARAALERESPLPPAVATAVRELADATALLAGAIAGGAEQTGLVEHAMSASAIASASLGAEPTMKHVVIVSQVRSITVDLLRAIGVDREQASARLQAAAGVRLRGHRRPAGVDLPAWDYLIGSRRGARRRTPRHSRGPRNTSPATLAWSRRRGRETWRACPPTTGRLVVSAARRAGSTGSASSGDSDRVTDRGSGAPSLSPR